MDRSELIKRYVPLDDIFLFNTGNAKKAWLLFGCSYIEEINMHRFVLWAPNAEAVSLVGDFNDWDRSALPMENCSGVWVCFVEGLKTGDLYKYCVTQRGGRQVLKSDPFARWSQSGIDTASRVWSDSHEWGDGEFMAKRSGRNPFAEPMSIYELHLGSWLQDENGNVGYREIAPKIADYCKEMGFTHLELLPLTEYPFPGSWGYQVTGYYAPTGRYGTPDDFAYFVDTMHRSGIGVIMDWVPAHFPKDEHGLAEFDGTRLYECKEKRMAEHPEWGTLVFDYAMSEVQSFLVSSACCFFENYHIDGIRVDAVSSMLYLNYGRRDGEYTPNREGGNINLDAVDFLRKLNATVLSEYPGAITVAEESTAYPMVSMPPELGGLGFTFKWDMGYMHDTLDYFSVDPFFRSKCHDKLTFSMMYAFSENFILAYSHDEVVHGKRSMLDKMFGDYEQKFATLRSLYGFQFGHPGKKLCFMGSEFGQFIEWNYEQSLDWLLLDYPKHHQMKDYYKALNELYLSTPAMYEVDKSWDGFKWLNVDDRDHSAVAFLRSSSPESKSYIVCACNFIPNENRGFVIGLPENGKLREILSSDDVRFGGSGLHNSKVIEAVEKPFNEHPYSAAIDLPPLSAVYFEFVPERKDVKNEKRTEVDSER